MNPDDSTQLEKTDPGPGGTEGFPAARSSKSADESLAAELERLRAMTVVERMNLALTLHRELQNLQPHLLKTK